MPDLSDTNDDLIGRVAGGDREAFAILYRRCRPDVYRFALHMCGSATVAEDVVQEVFLAVIQDAARYRPARAGVLSWLLGIARNHVRRSRHRRAVVPLPGEETPDGRRLAVETDPIADLTCQRRTEALARALLDVPAHYREAVVLCDLQELSYETAAGILGCATGTVRSRLHRGRVRLARVLCPKGREVACPLPAAKTS